METKNQDSNVLEVVHWMRYSHHFTVPPVGLSGGLALFWKEEAHLVVLESSPNIVDV